MIRPATQNSLVVQSDTKSAAGEAPSGDWLGYPSSGSAADAGKSVSFSLLLNSLSRWWKSATCCGLLLAAIAVWYVWQGFVPFFQATAWIQVDTQPAFLAFAERGHESKYALSTVVELIRSPAVLDDVMDREELEGRGLSADSIAHDLQIEQQNESELFRVSYAHVNPETAAIVVNTVLDVYSKVQVDSTRARTQRVIKLLEEDKSRRSTALEELRVKQRLMLVRYPEFAPLVDARNQHQDASSILQQRLIETEVKHDMLQAQLSGDRETLAAGEVTVPQSVIDDALDNDMRIRRVMDELTAKEEHLASSRAISVQGDETPIIRQLIAEIAHHKERLAELRKQVRPTVATRMQEQAKGQREHQLSTGETELVSLKATQRRLQQQLSEHNTGGSHASNPALAEFKTLAGEISRSEEVFRQIADRAEGLRTEVGAPSRITRIRDASVPKYPVIANPFLKMSLAGTASFLLPFAVCLLWDRRSRRIIESSQIHQDVGLHVVGEVVRLPRDAHRQQNQSTERQQRERRMHDESIDAICTRLLLSPDLQNVQVLATASAVSGEGKTHLASHLSVSLSRSFDDTTLVIDGDLRSPALDRAFEISNDRGLADVLDGRCTLDEAVVTTWSSSLHILPAGKLTCNPHTLLRGPAFGDLMQTLRARYRYIVIDVPPVLAASESLIVAEAADATLLCAMRDVSRAPQVKLAYERLLAANASPLGVVLGGVPTRHYQSTYGAYYYQTCNTPADGEAARRSRRAMISPQAEQEPKR